METGRQYYPLSIWQRILSVLVIIVLAIALVPAWYNGMWALAVALWVIILPAVGWSIAIIPRYTEVTEKQIIVKQVWGQLVFDKKEVEIVPIVKDDLKSSIRTFGNGGLFGYAGYFQNKKLGKYRMYVTRMKDLSLLTDRNGQKTVINLRQAYPPHSSST
ncbi:PH domain-containing protein [Porphyromonas gulae]|uniref:PH domain-containing protein n=2 Tax=Porphyromonas gulae TaxID=111105 RepID=UPI00051CF338|nr:PH domain-containing protein [Porphyromonas gulae]KGL50358.1 hypothetical protein HQ49_00550 [Porphyromonas gulae]